MVSSMPKPFLRNHLFVVIPKVSRDRSAELQRTLKSLERIHRVAYILDFFAIISSFEKQFPCTSDERVRCLFNAHRELRWIQFKDGGSVKLSPVCGCRSGEIGSGHRVLNPHEDDSKNTLACQRCLTILLYQVRYGYFRELCTSRVKYSSAKLGLGCC